LAKACARAWGLNARKPAQDSGDCRAAFEENYDAKYDQKHFNSFNGVCYTYADDEVRQALNQDWIAFKKGFQAAWTYHQPVEVKGGESERTD
jgi:hypothetical protein